MTNGNQIKANGCDRERKLNQIQVQGAYILVIMVFITMFMMLVELRM